MWLGNEKEPNHSVNYCTDQIFLLFQLKATSHIMPTNRKKNAWSKVMCVEYGLLVFTGQYNI